ncbi:MAG: amidohydrolase family protein, partial [Candidatus Anstonellaceae archaeon]
MSLILIKGGKIVTPDAIISSDLLIEDEKITKVARTISAHGAETIDASGLLILPGAIDAHVHFRDPEDTSKEDFSTGTASALAGGVTTIMDMPNYRNPPTTSIAAYKAKQSIAASKARCDYLLRFGASESNFAEAAQSGAPQLKIFLTDTSSELGCSNEAAIKHFQSFPKEKPVCVHAEDRRLIAERSKKYSLHHEIRDTKVAQVACEFALREAGKLGRRVHICHVTTALELEMCRQYSNATYEITPNHLFLSQADLKRLSELGKINPPLRTHLDQKALWDSLNDDTIIASDHAPHLISHKREGAPGFPGVGTLLPLMLNAAHEKRLTLQQVVRMCSCNPAKAFSLSAKGSLLPTFDADIVLV